MKPTFCKIIRATAIILMALTVAFTLLGAIGTTCAAFKPENFDSMLPLAPYKWLYQLLVVISLAAGIAGIRALFELLRSTPASYRDTLVVLVAGGAAALVQVIASRILRGKSMPTDVRLYITVVTLAVFLILRIPAIWQGVGLTRGRDRGSPLAGGVAAILMGVLTLTVHQWAAPTHTFDGVNYASVWPVSLTLLGLGLCLGGVGLLLRDFLAEAPSAAAEQLATS